MKNIELLNSVKIQAPLGTTKRILQVKHFTLLAFCLTAFMLNVPLSAQQTFKDSIFHDSLKREYILYVPENYEAETATPLVLNFHGFTSNATEQMFYGDFRGIADTAGFIVVHPEGTLLNGLSHWNVGGWTTLSTVDDLGFTSVLIDSLSLDYNIDPDRIYATGMSNGGYMSFLLACQLGHKIAAVASVTGSMTPETYTDCLPDHPTPIMQIHGTADPVVPYDGAVWSQSIQSVLDYWVIQNECQPTAETESVEDINIFDGSTAERISYKGGNNNSDVIHYKITNGAHTWPGTFFGGAGTNMDFNASEVIWQFFSRYSLSDLKETTETKEIDHSAALVTIFPNPAKNRIYVSAERHKNEFFEIYTMTGSIVKSGTIHSGRNDIDVSELDEGLYVFKVGEKTKLISIH